MLSAEYFINLLAQHDIGFFTGVPDSLLKSLCAYIAEQLPQENHLICTNEGAAISLAVGYHLATNKIAAVYMQNSGLGNAANPLISLVDKDVYSIPLLMVVGWRGKPGEKDEPQHKKQGRITLGMLEAMEIPYEIITADQKSAARSVEKASQYMRKEQAPFALVVCRDTFQLYKPTAERTDPFFLQREDAIKLIIDSLDDNDIIVSTTGMASREVFEYRDCLGYGHNRDFLVVGGMGHASQIALGIALKKRDRNVYCIDGDGAVLMHMGSLATNGVQNCDNFNHIILNNGAHDSVGGQPTVGFDIDFAGIAHSAGYRTVMSAEKKEAIVDCLIKIKKLKGPSFFEIRVNKGSRKDLGRPTVAPIDNKKFFMKFLR